MIFSPFRGELGDCRDPFFLTANSTRLLSKAAGVETPECASGWCSKTVEGLDNLVCSTVKTPFETH